MVVFEYAEAIVLLIGIVGFVPALLDFRSVRTNYLFFIGFATVLLGLVATNLEAFIFENELNLIEHALGMLLPGVLFLLWARKNYHDQSFIRKNIERMSNGARK